MKSSDSNVNLNVSKAAQLEWGRQKKLPEAAWKSDNTNKVGREM